MAKEYIFNRISRRYWIKSINSICKNFIHHAPTQEARISVRLDGDVTVDNFTPVHIVLLACFLDHFIDLGYNISMSSQDNRFQTFLFDDLKFPLYFDPKGKQSHVEADTPAVLNLWKVVDSEAYSYSQSVADYFRKTHFNGCDLTSFSLSLYEIYQNVADHSQSKGRAFSYIHYEKEKRMIHVATCDFGIGIPTTLRNSGKQYESDTHALRNSIETGVTANSHPHNKGFGLDNVVSSLSDGDMLRIISNKALLFCFSDKSNLRLYPLGFDFRGTLLYFDVSVDSFTQEETLFNTGLDF